MKKLFPLFLLLAGLSILAVSCGAEPVEVTVPVEVTRIVEVTPETAEEDMAPAVEIPYLSQWEASPHNDAEAEAFRHWDEDPGEVEAACAQCHSSYGYQDFLGADGSAPGVDGPAELGSTVNCVACHNSVTATLDSVTMPSGVELTGLGDESRCMVCHQGRASKIAVDEATADMDADTVSEDLGFINIHYFAAAATKYGTLAKGGYEYDGKTYDAEFAHVEGYDTCIDCHNPHTLEVKVEECSVCHEGVTTVEDFKDVRMQGSQVDYDGDGNIEEGVYYELVGLQDLLLQAMQSYAADVAGTQIAYNSAAYPYFFIDTNGDGEAGDDEANYGNRYVSWTPRLLKAAYNYQVAEKDPGDFAHGGKYIIALLYDSIEDLNQGTDLTNAHRIDHGHFAGSEEAFRHWDEDGEVSGSCAKCHSAGGLPEFLAEGVNVSQPISNGFQCSTCHNEAEWPSIYAVTSVTFPSGATVSSEEATPSLLCMNCHQGRASGADVDARIASGNLGFVNVHYFAAGATRNGSDVAGMYQYTGKDYAGPFVHPVNECVDCHDPHKLEVEVEKCSACHPGVTAVTEIRGAETPDYDGDGVEEGVAGEVATFTERLYEALQANAEANDTPLVYDPGRYPYFFDDAGERFAGWTPELLKAAYNYQYAQKDPGAFAHNAPYVLQALYDSIQDLGGDTSGLTRP